MHVSIHYFKIIIMTSPEQLLINLIETVCLLHSPVMPVEEEKKESNKNLFI